MTGRRRLPVESSANLSDEWEVVQMKKIRNDGGSFESFLEEEGILDEVDEAAIKRIADWQAAQEMKARQLNGP